MIRFSADGYITTAYAACGAAAAADGPLPAMDAVAVVVAVVITAYLLHESYQVNREPAKEKEESITSTIQQKKQAYFPANPYHFCPRGLTMIEHAGSWNGKIIEWRDPASQIKIFEWDEDFKNGSHYHAMMIEWDGKHLGPHYEPYDAVPEPWNTIYFGG